MNYGYEDLQDGVFPYHSDLLPYLMWDKCFKCGRTLRAGDLIEIFGLGHVPIHVDCPKRKRIRFGIRKYVRIMEEYFLRMMKDLEDEEE